jgi:putative phage-type endonuclease
VDYIIERVRQGSDSWLAWRRNGIGASDAPAIMGENPWKTPQQMLLEKVGKSTSHSNAAMIRGTALEPEARRHYMKSLGVKVKPECLRSTAYDWLRASVDGLSQADQLVVEIKCGFSVYKHTAQSKQPPSYYYAQLQHILAVTGYDKIDFWCYLPKLPCVHVEVQREDRYIQRMLEVEHAFWQRVNRI